MRALALTTLPNSPSPRVSSRMRLLRGNSYFLSIYSTQRRIIIRRMIYSICQVLLQDEAATGNFYFLSIGPVCHGHYTVNNHSAIYI